ncbi:MAG: hypothetical protein Q8S26_12845 [Azonexus sp.]|nr:hypothetical protein [Azonexus sp.]
MSIPLIKEDFLHRNNIDQDTWNKAEIEWNILEEIANDHEQQLVQLEESATLFARLIQKYKHVHSVRWRVKNSEHLVEKIIRKRAESNEKYTDISAENYFEIVTDLVGIRVLHLFKEDCFSIHLDLTSQWDPIETPVSYIRTGDRDELISQFNESGFEIKEHPAGYRSVHYVFSSQPMKRKVVTEVQVRTIFEEGWSEIDHTVRYPNFSDNELVEYFLTIFNRLAGSADEMGGFVRRLAGNLTHMESQISAAKDDNASILRDMELTLGELEKTKAQGRGYEEHIGKLKSELEKLKVAEKTSFAASRGLDIESPAYIRRGALGLVGEDLARKNTKRPGLATIYEELAKHKNGGESTAQLDALAAAAKGLDLSRFSKKYSSVGLDVSPEDLKVIHRLINSKNINNTLRKDIVNGVKSDKDKKDQ